MDANEGGLIPILNFQRSNKRTLRDVDIADAAHAFLALFLFIKQLTFTTYIATITFGGNVFAHGFHCLTRDNFAANCCLNGDREKLTWD